MNGKIGLEEHFVTAALEEECITSVGWDPKEWRGVLDRLEDFDRRLAQMDEVGIDVMVLSLGSDGAQGIPDSSKASSIARGANDALAGIVARHPERFAGFAAVAMQDPQGAADEAERGVRELGFRGVLVNGYSDMPDGSGAYYDGPEYIPFWERLAELDVPFYLHPRNPLAANAGIYSGREELLGPSWAFAVETGTHALRLITSGLFDRLPDLQVILGHLGEQLPFAMARLEQRISHNPRVKLRRSPRRVFRENFHITTSGNYHTPSLLGAMLELGADRVMFSTDYPFERMRDAAEWFDALAISEADRLKIGRTNAATLLRLSDQSRNTAPTGL
jgi:predicted TIM-barrel fold metal-dependent hydrolase